MTDPYYYDASESKAHADIETVHRRGCRYFGNIERPFQITTPPEGTKCSVCCETPSDADDDE